jgi:hypothetical protein
MNDRKILFQFQDDDDDDEFLRQHRNDCIVILNDHVPCNIYI